MTITTGYTKNRTVPVVVLLFWLFVPTETAIKRVGERYAEQLLDSATVL
jgi:hypothetical protein